MLQGKAAVYVGCVIIRLLVSFHEEDHKVHFDVLLRRKTYLNHPMIEGVFIVSVSGFLILSQEQSAGA